MDETITPSSETWYVEICGETREVAFEELVHLASSGELKREDKVRRGNLRWLEAGRVPSLAGYFAHAEGNEAKIRQPTLVASSSECAPEAKIQSGASSLNPTRAAASYSVFINSVLVIVILSFALTYLWTYYREKAEEMEKAAIPGAPPAKTTAELLLDYRREHESLKELRAENEEDMAGLSSNSPRFLGYGGMDACYRIKYDPDLPTGHPQLSGRVPVEIGRELDEECAARQRKTEEQYSQIRESDLKQRYNDKMMKRSAYAARLGDLDQKIAAAQKRLDTGFFGVALEAGFYWAFFPIFMVVTMLNFFRLYLKKKIAEPLSPV